MKDYTICKPVMLPINEGSGGFGAIMLDVRGPRLWLNQGEASNDYFHKAQHLYLVSDEEIKEGDTVFYYDLLGHTEGNPYKVLWVNHLTGYIRTQANKKWIEYDTPPAHFKKIIASTDSSLGLPLILQSFVEEYVHKQGKIDKVRIRLVVDPDNPANWYRDCPSGKYSYDEPIPPSKDNLYTDGTKKVIILPIKDSWNREDLVDAFLAGQHSSLSFDEWFDKNY